MGTIFGLLSPRGSSMAPPSAPLHSNTRFQVPRLPTELEEESHVWKATGMSRIYIGHGEALRDWCTQLDDWGFPPRMDLLRAMADTLTSTYGQRKRGTPNLLADGYTTFFNAIRILQRSLEHS